MHKTLVFSPQKFTARRRLLMTAADFSRRIGVARATVSQWEAGRYPPSPRRFAAIARVLGCEVADIVDAPPLDGGQIVAEFAAAVHCLTLDDMAAIHAIIAAAKARAAAKAQPQAAGRDGGNGGDGVTIV